MVPLQMIASEVLIVLNYGIWFLGLVTIVMLVCVLLYTVLISGSIEIGENRGESSVYDRKDMPATAQALRVEQLSTGEILDKCTTHRQQLKHWHQVLCERAGIEPGSLCMLDDLIGQAVFDGRQQYNCINAVDRVTQARKVEQQHA